MKVKPKHWWQWFSISFWRVKKLMEFLMEQPTYKNEVEKLVRKGILFGEESITEKDILKAVRKLKNERKS